MDRIRPLVTLLTLFACASMLLGPARVAADAQASVRGGLGMGKRFADVGDEFIFDINMRGDVMFGAPRPRAFRLGPIFELRTADFWSIEGAAGAGLLIPLPGDFPIGLSGLVGYAHRREAPDAPVGIAHFTWGYRGYNYHSWYGYALNVFVTARRDLDGEPLDEITGGLELDLMFTTIMPLLTLLNLTQSGDPDEPRKKKK